MGGLYLHIPFCRQACVYCNFHFSTRVQNKPRLLQAMHREMALRQNYLRGESLSSVYLGGGTPSVLTAEEINKLFETIGQYHTIERGAEITLEANPDDLSGNYLRELATTPVNRLSIGVQSFRDVDLKFMNRSHNARQSLQSIEQAQDLGFKNLSIDLIYGLPDTATETWETQLEQMKMLKVPHFSAYALTVEPKTALHHQIQSGKREPLDEERAYRHFQALQSFAAQNGYCHYELSNLAQKGREAVHNSNYWTGEKYLGIGPAAHSYNGAARHWNIGNNALYAKNLEREIIPQKEEKLSAKDAFNEYLMTGLRLQKGISWKQIQTIFGPHFYEFLQFEARDELRKGRLVSEGDTLFIPEAWRFQSDGIAASLFLVEEVVDR